VVEVLDDTVVSGPTESVTAESVTAESVTAESGAIEVTSDVVTLDSGIDSFEATGVDAPEHAVTMTTTIAVHHLTG
jgi:hypothetical protein